MILVLKLHFYELKFRTIYLLISYILSFLILFIYKIELFYIISKLFLNFANGFIFTKITEPFFIYLKLILLFSFLIFWFLGLYFYGFFFFKSFYNYHIKIFWFFIFIFYIIFFFFYIYIFQNVLIIVFTFFLKFERSNFNDILFLNLEAKIEDYWNIFSLFIIFLLILIHIPFFLILIFIKLKKFNILKYRKYVHLLIFFIFLFLAPPDFSIQIIIYPFIILIIEIFFLITYLFKILWKID